MNDVQTTTARDTAAQTLVPPVDVIEDATGLTLLVDMPGVPKDKIDLKIEGDSLLIGGDIAAVGRDGMQAVYAEVQVARYRRAFTLSRELDAGRIEATGKDGTLRLRIPKTEAAQPRRIAVQGS
jgi:HSP20 family protein